MTETGDGQRFMFDSVGNGLGVIVVNYNSSSLLRTYLAVARFPLGTRVTVVDNSERADEKLALLTLADTHGWHVIDAGSNLGFGAAMNVGADDAIIHGCTDLLLLNPDASISEADLAVLRTILAENPGAMVSPRIMRDDGRLWFDGAVILPVAGRAVHRPVTDRSDWISAACLLVPATAWRTLGGMDSDYFLYWEDVDLTYRWKRQGGTLIVASDVEAIHSVGGTQSGGIGKSTTYLYYNCRNRLLFAAKNLGLGRTLLWLSTTPHYWMHMLRQARIKQSTDPAGALAAILRGSLAGVAMMSPALTQELASRRNRTSRGART